MHFNQVTFFSSSYFGGSPSHLSMFCALAQRFLFWGTCRSTFSPAVHFAAEETAQNASPQRSPPHQSRFFSLKKKPKYNNLTRKVHLCHLSFCCDHCIFYLLIMMFLCKQVNTVTTWLPTAAHLSWTIVRATCKTFTNTSHTNSCKFRQLFKQVENVKET